MERAGEIGRVVVCGQTVSKGNLLHLASTQGGAERRMLMVGQAVVFKEAEAAAAATEEVAGP